MKKESKDANSYVNHIVIDVNYNEFIYENSSFEITSSNNLVIYFLDLRENDSASLLRWAVYASGEWRSVTCTAVNEES